MRDKLLVTLTRIGELLESCGEQSRAAWFRERLTILKREDTKSARFQVVLRELRGILGGMGSFSDLALNPAPASGLTRQEARSQQWELVENLDEALRDLLVDLA